MSNFCSLLRQATVLNTQVLNLITLYFCSLVKGSCHTNVWLRGLFTSENYYSKRNWIVTLRSFLYKAGKPLSLSKFVTNFEIQLLLFGSESQYYANLYFSVKCSKFAIYYPKYVKFLKGCRGNLFVLVYASIKAKRYASKFPLHFIYKS